MSSSLSAKLSCVCAQDFHRDWPITIKSFEHMTSRVKGSSRRPAMSIIPYSVKARMPSGSHVMYVKATTMTLAVANIHKKSTMLIKCFNEYGALVFLARVQRENACRAVCMLFAIIAAPRLVMHPELRAVSTSARRRAAIVATRSSEDASNSLRKLFLPSSSRSAPSSDSASSS